MPSTSTSSTSISTSSTTPTPRSPQTKLGPQGSPDPKLCEPFAVEAHYFTESRLLQRDVEIVLESHSFNAMNKNTTLVGSVIHPAGNIAEALLREGMAKCVDWSIAKVAISSTSSPSFNSSLFIFLSISASYGSPILPPIPQAPIFSSHPLCRPPISRHF